MRRRLLISGVCLLAMAAVTLLVFQATWRAGGLAQETLFRIEAAHGLVPHAGILVTTLFLGDRPVSTRVQLTCAGDYRTRIEYLSEPMRGLVVVEERARTWRLDPTQGLLLVENPLASGRQRRLALLLSNYAPRYLGRGRIARRPALRIALVNRRGGWVARRLWGDEPTGLPLRWDEYRPDGRLAMSTAYREVRFTRPGERPVRIAPPPLPVAAGSARPMPEVDLSRHLGTPVAHPRHVPEGFVYEGSFLGRWPGPCGQPVAHLRYSDGLRTISLFQSARAPENADDPEGITLVYAGMARIHHRGATFVFVGDAGDAELARMAESLP